MKVLISLGKYIALISFYIGTITLIFYFFFKKEDAFILFGMYYVLIAFIINCILFIVNIIALIIDQKLRLELLKTCGIMLLNIPIAIGYFYIVINT